ncbi:MAG: NADP-specific glutamate dehydrogenase [Propionibacteriaceae bacterium]|jgi:glutamate dehydrogenase (NADP+)|nr:NADP-specific glutamate dehydrogenase [Propionibacteriaceae bacterium]
MFQTDYAQRVFTEVSERTPWEAEFLQAVREVLLSIEPVLKANPGLEDTAILERVVEPDRQIKFRVAWTDDAGRIRVNRGYRFEFNAAIGPYKGGLRFHSSVNASILKFLGFEQVFKNSLTGLWMGGGKGGSDFDTHGKSDAEVMRFCQAFMTELYRHIGPDTDVPAGDIGVGGREVGYLFGQYRRITNEFTGVLTGKGLDFGGSLARTEATGYGLCYYTQEVLRLLKKDSFDGKIVAVSGSGNVAIFAAEKATQLGGRVVTMSDSSGYVYDPEGIDVEAVKQIKLVDRGRMSAYVNTHPKATYVEGRRVWEVPCDIALPCATQNELDLSDAQGLIQAGVTLVAEGANMPTTPDAIEALRAAGVLFCPGKASNAGGVAVSGLEMAQDSQRLQWTFEQTDEKLQSIMKSIVANTLSAAERYGLGPDLFNGANIAGFERVVNAMTAQGVF